MHDARRSPIAALSRVLAAGPWRRLALASAVIAAPLAASGAATEGTPPEAPPGYGVRAESGAWRFRPLGEGDPELVISVFPRVASARSASDVLADWLAANPAPGKPARPRTDASGVSVVVRETLHGRRPCRELVTAIPVSDGVHQIESIVLPGDRKKTHARQMEAGAAIGRAIQRGDVPDPPNADGSERAPIAGVPAARSKDDSPKPSSESSRPAPREVASPPSGSAVRSAALASESTIETVGFDTRARMGAGGMILAVPVPIVLFRSGEAVDDIEALAHDGGLAAHRAKNPDDWGRWRRAGGGIEMFRQGVWKRLAFTTTMDRLPAGFTLDGRYRSMSGAGTVAIGGTSSVVAWSDLTFDRAGGFVTGGGAGGSSESPDGQVRTTTSSTAAGRRGRYSIEGYTLTLKYDSGRVERRLLVADPADPRTLWLDGDGWVRR